MARKGDDRMRHTLKCEPEPFARICSGVKRHEVRKPDRDYQVGDVLLLLEFDPNKVGEARYSGNEILMRVTYISMPGTWGLPDDVCVMSIRELAEGEDPGDPNVTWDSHRCPRACHPLVATGEFDGGSMQVRCEECSSIRWVKRGGVVSRCVVHGCTSAATDGDSVFGLCREHGGGRPPIRGHDVPVGKLLVDGLAEADRALQAYGPHPSAEFAANRVTEELLELVQAATSTTRGRDSGRRERIYTEAVQAVAMIVRLWREFPDGAPARPPLHPRVEEILREASAEPCTTACPGRHGAALANVGEQWCMACRARGELGEAGR